MKLRSLESELGYKSFSQVFSDGIYFAIHKWQNIFLPRFGHPTKLIDWNWSINQKRKLDVYCNSGVAAELCWSGRREKYLCFGSFKEVTRRNALLGKKRPQDVLFRSYKLEFMRTKLLADINYKWQKSNPADSPEHFIAVVTQSSHFYLQKERKKISFSFHFTTLENLMTGHRIHRFELYFSVLVASYTTLLYTDSGLSSASRKKGHMTQIGSGSSQSSHFLAVNFIARRKNT